MIETRYPRVGVGVFVTNDHGHVLLGRRLGKYGTGFLSLPGGKVDWFERLKDCAARETLEETNLITKNLKMVGVMDEIFPEYDEHYATTYFFGYAENPNALRNTEPHKHESWNWYDILNDGLPDGLWTPLKEFLSDSEQPRLLYQELATHRYWNSSR